jgi:DNA adenine methylase
MIIRGTFLAEEVWSKPLDYVQSPFRYPGGKYYALKYIVPFIDSYEHDLYVEPFIGGGSVFFGKKKAKENWLNDLDTDLIKTYRAIQEPRRNKALISRVTKEVASRDRHAEIVRYNAETDDDIAYKTYYLNRTSYSGIIHKPAWGYAIGASSPPPNWGRFLLNANQKLESVKLKSDDFEVILSEIPKNRKTLVYLDPPYYLADQKRAYRKSFVYEDHIRLAKCLKKLKHAFVLSYDDCKEIRTIYDWTFNYERSWFYNTANSSGPRPMGKELLITNFEIMHNKQENLFSTFESVRS